jgi:hypothetical protein
MSEIFKLLEWYYFAILQSVLLPVFWISDIYYGSASVESIHWLADLDPALFFVSGFQDANKKNFSSKFFLPITYEYLRYYKIFSKYFGWLMEGCGSWRPKN